MGITCKQAVDYVSKKEEEKLTLLQRWQLWKHLNIFRACRLFNKQNKLLTAIFKKRPANINKGLNTTEKQAIIKALKEADEGGNR